MMQNNLFTTASFISFSLPIFVVVYYRLYRHLSIVALVLYFGLKLFQFFTGGVNLAEEGVANVSDLFFNSLQLPLLLSALLFFCSAGRQQERMQALILLFVLYEIVMLLFVDYTVYTGLTIVLPGIVLVVLHSLFLFMHQLRFTIVHRKNSGKLLILGAILLSGSFQLAALYADFIPGKIGDDTVQMLYRFVHQLSALILSLGIFSIRHRIKGLQDLKIARREMQILFGG